MGYEQINTRIVPVLRVALRKIHAPIMGVDQSEGLFPHSAGALLGSCHQDGALKDPEAYPRAVGLLLKFSRDLPCFLLVFDCNKDFISAEHGKSPRRVVSGKFRRSIHI